MKKFILLIICELQLLLCGCDFSSKSTVVCFVGDSITYQWDLDYFFPEFRTIKFAENGAPLEKMDEWNLSECKDNATVVLLGTNNSATFYTEQGRNDFVQKYINRVKSIQADPLIVISILPRDFLGKQGAAVNDVIQKVNILIQEHLKKDTIAFRYVNVYPSFIQEDLKIRTDLFKDGLHPNLYGQEILASEVHKQL